jgi:hypothetical protein
MEGMSFELNSTTGTGMGCSNCDDLINLETSWHTVKNTRQSLSEATNKKRQSPYGPKQQIKKISEHACPNADDEDVQEMMTHADSASESMYLR